MSEFKSNSYKSKEAKESSDSKVAKPAVEKRITKPVVTSAKTRKKGEMTKFKDAFIAEDAATVKSYIVGDVIIPAVKRVISDIIIDGVSMIFHGTPASGRDRGRGSTPKVSYRSYYDDPRDRRGSEYNPVRAGYYADDVILPSRYEAEEVLMTLNEAISVYGLVSVADLYDCVNRTGSHTDNKYGWLDLRAASIVPTRGGFLLKMPRAQPLHY